MNYERFKDLTFDDFKKLARDDTLTSYEKIGFPNSYREGQEESIFTDILSKLSHINQHNKTIVDIGVGCSGLALAMIDICRTNHHHLILIDSEEMLNLLPDAPFVTKIPGYYPNDCLSFLKQNNQKIDTIIVYSVIQYVFAESNIFKFVDVSLDLLAEQGEMLIGDIPNVSKRKRFFSSNTGIQYHQVFTNTETLPDIKFNVLEQDKIDDAVVLSLVSRCRNAGFDAYILPQTSDLPMANRREDILIRRP